MSWGWQVPALILGIGAVLIWFTPRMVRQALLLLLPVICLALTFQHPNELNIISLIFLLSFLIFGFLANLYALHTDNKLILVFANLYFASSVGAVLAEDLMSLFVFWEGMAITSCFVIYNPKRKSSMNAIFRYFLVHLTGGLFFFSGLMIKYVNNHELALGQMDLDLAGILIFLGFAINAAIPPFHAWLPDAYPEGTPEGSVYLSAFTTKVAVYAFARCFFGHEILILLGAIAAVYGVVYALLENDMRKLLSYHIVCQVGYMLCGIGIGSHEGMNGGIGHAVGNILFKGLLFMATGALIHMTGKYKLTELGDLFRRSRSTFVFFMIGAFAISGLPGLNGYITKSFLFNSAAYAHIDWLELTLTIVAAGTFLSIALKLAYFAFLTKPGKLAHRVKALPKNAQLAMCILASVCILIGLFPSVYLYPFLPHAIEHSPFTAKHLIHTLQLLLATAFGFTLILKNLKLKDKITLDLDFFYRKGARLFVDGLCAPIKLAQEKIQDGWTQALTKSNKKILKATFGQNVQPIKEAFLLLASASVLIAFVLILYR